MGCNIRKHGAGANAQNGARPRPHAADDGNQNREVALIEPKKKGGQRQPPASHTPVVPPFHRSSLCITTDSILPEQQASPFLFVCFNQRRLAARFFFLLSSRFLKRDTGQITCCEKGRQVRDALPRYGSDTPTQNFSVSLGTSTLRCSARVPARRPLFCFGGVGPPRTADAPCKPAAPLRHLRIHVRRPFPSPSPPLLLRLLHLLSMRTPVQHAG